MVHLLPKYRQKVKQSKPIKKTVYLWSAENKEKLQDCFDETDWQMFFDSCDGDPHLLTETLTDYMLWCESNCIEKKEVKVYPNNKPWLTKNLKECLNKKKHAHVTKDKEQYNLALKDFRSQIDNAKRDYKDRVEDKLVTGNAKQAWDGLNKMMGRNGSNKQCVDVNKQFVDDLNNHYARFDTCDFSEEREKECERVPLYESISLTEEEVTACLSRINPNKAPGPDGLGGRLLKECKQQLRGVITMLFQHLLNTRTVPLSWKRSTIVPLPKKRNACILNDFRPVALTPILAK